jgi:neutral ceramidase
MSKHLAFICLTIIPLIAITNIARAQLRAGAATSNITPELGSEIIGGFVPFPATHVHDELHARCLVLDDGKTKLAIVVCDLLGMHRSLCVEARRLTQESTGILSDNILICGTHTHSAATALGPNRYSSDEELTDYQQFVARRVADGIKRAANLLRPAEVGFGQVEVPEHLFNRRWFMKEGTVPVNPFGKFDKVKMNPSAGSKDLIEPAGTIDPTVSFIALREAKTTENSQPSMIAVFSAYSLHYVGGVGDGAISADYFGYYCEALKRLQSNPNADPPFVALMANGTSGDVNNINFVQPRGRRAPYEQMSYVAEDIAVKVNAAIANLSWESQAELSAEYREMDLKWRQVDDGLLNWVQETEAKVPASLSKNDLGPIYAGRIRKLADASPETKAPVQALKIGDICIGTSPCETFAETGLEFKNRCPFKKSFMVELAHGYYGYLPTPRHFELGGYETWPGTNYLEPQASVKIMDELIEMSRTLHR